MVEIDLKHINDPDVTITTRDTFPPTGESPFNNEELAWQILTNAALEVFPDCVPVPGTMVANTDTIHYLKHTDKIYRLVEFWPAQMVQRGFVLKLAKIGK